MNHPYINPPKKIPLLIRFGAWVAEKKTNKEIVIPRLLSWIPKIAISSGFLETSVLHGDAEIPHRLLQLTRIQVSAMVGCPFCLDMNTNKMEDSQITSAELAALQNPTLALPDSFSPAEHIALTYVRAMTTTPATVTDEMMEKVKATFSSRQIVAICATAAQVNYWSRTLKGLGVPLACPIK